jgi:ribosomal 30S subunit maturation factor RimM
VLPPTVGSVSTFTSSNNALSSAAPERNPEASPPQGWWRLGRLGRPFQTRGALRLQSLEAAYDQVASELAQHNAEVFLSGVGLLRLRGAQRTGDGVALSFAGHYTPERARVLVHAELWAPPSTQPQPAQHTPAIAGLEGADVVLSGVVIGRVARVLHGPQTLLELTRETSAPAGGNATAQLLPWGAPYVVWTGERIELHDPPAGLLDDDPTGD